MTTTLANILLTSSLTISSFLTGITILASNTNNNKDNKKNNFYNHASIIQAHQQDATSITIKSINNWYINTIYTPKITLDNSTTPYTTPPSYKDSSPNKTNHITWLVPPTTKSATIKLVFCNETSCTPPTSTHVSL